jgi:cell surface protein SprA
MKNLITFITFALLLLVGCKEDCNCPTDSSTQDTGASFEISTTEYSDNDYFLDEVYTDTTADLNLYNQFYGNTLPIVSPKYYVKNIEVFKSVATISLPPEALITGIAYTNLPPRNFSNLYSDSLRNIQVITPGQVESTRFQQLSEGSDYIFHPETGYLSLLFDIKDSEVLAVSYSIENELSAFEDDIIYGEFLEELVNSPDTILVLKLIKPRNLIPSFEDAWKLKLKNIYKIEPYLGGVTNLDFDIYLQLLDGTEIDKINGQSFLQIFGFDKFDEQGNNVPDGKLDDRPGLTYNPETSEIIFPVIQPFGKNLPAVLDDSLMFQPIYDTTKSAASHYNHNKFIIKGKYVPR